MQCLAHTESRAQFSPAFSETIEIPEASGNLYRTLQQEVELGAQALRSERADMAVTSFSNAPQKNFFINSFFEPFVPHLLFAYMLPILQMMKHSGNITARESLCAAFKLVG